MTNETDPREEIVARALCRLSGSDPDHLDATTGYRRWETRREAARAILAALDAARPVEPPVDEEVAREAFSLRNTLSDARRDASNWRRLHDEQEAEVERLSAEVARLTKDRDEFAELVVEYGAMHSPDGMEILAKDRDKWFDRATAAEAEIADLRAKLAQAVEALEPFTLPDVYSPDIGYFTIGDLRRARAALASIKEPRT